MKKLLLLHGALGAKEQFNPLTEKLNSNYDVHTFNFQGHGRSAIPAEPFSIEMFAGDIISYLDENNINSIDIFGYSMGGYAALYAAINNPGRIGKIFTLATKFEWNPEIAEREIKMLDAEKIKQKVPKFAEELSKRHGADKWEIVLEKTAEMMKGLGESGGKHGGFPLQLDNINNEVLVGIGDSDKMVILEESKAASENLPNAKLIVLPGTPHPIELVDVDRLAEVIFNFFK